MSGGGQVSVDLEVAQQTDHARDMEQPVESENDLLGVDEFVIPDGDQYSLVSKRLKPANHGSTGSTYSELYHRGKTCKLTEMEYEPESVQVIIQGRGDDASMYLVNDTGIIKTIECVKVVYRTNDETSSKSADSCSALQDTRHVEPVVEVESRPGEIVS